MLGHEPEVQVIRVPYYSGIEGYAPDITDAIADHYRPLGPTDQCPSAPVSVAVALADKIDSLVGFFAIDEKPTGSKDPFALRRAALGVIRLILENGLRLKLRDVFGFAYSGLNDQSGFEQNQPKAVVAQLLEFFADRLKVALKEQGVRHDLIAAGFALGDEDDLVRLVSRVKALQDLVDSDAGANLLAAYRRASNIVRIEEKKDGATYDGAADAAKFALDEERKLFGALDKESEAARKRIANEEFVAAMGSLSNLRAPIDAFFDRVTVNDPD